MKLIQNQYISFYRRYIEKQKKNRNWQRKPSDKAHKAIPISKYLYLKQYSYNYTVFSNFFT